MQPLSKLVVFIPYIGTFKQLAEPHLLARLWAPAESPSFSCISERPAATAHSQTPKLSHFLLPLVLPQRDSRMVRRGQRMLKEQPVLITLWLLVVSRGQFFTKEFGCLWAVQACSSSYFFTYASMISCIHTLIQLTEIPCFPLSPQTCHCCSPLSSQLYKYRGQIHWSASDYKWSAFFF